MSRKQTSQRVSSLAAKYIRMSDHVMGQHAIHSELSKQFFADIRSMAASLLSQDEVKGENERLKAINANLMGDDENQPRYTTKRLKQEIAAALERAGYELGKPKP